MSVHTLSVDVSADAATAFDLIHNYDRRLEWDSMLSEARLLGGATQAAEALKLIAGIGESLAGRLLLLDAQSMHWHDVRVPRDPACPVCAPLHHSALAQ